MTQLSFSDAEHVGKRMPCIHLLQQRCGLSDPAMEEGLYEIASMRKFARLPLLAAVNRHPRGKSIVRVGTSVEGGTTIDASSATKNRSGTRDPGRYRTKKGDQRFSGMKAQIGAGGDSELGHTALAATANVADATLTDKVLQGQERAVFTDAGYMDADKREKLKDKELEWHIAERPNKFKALPAGELEDVSELLQHLNAKMRAKVEYSFRVVKRQLGYAMARYRDLTKNAGQLSVLFRWSNQWMARKLLVIIGKVRSHRMPERDSRLGRAAQSGGLSPFPRA
ncbi:transposase [Luteimonas salinisoli]|uniref:transposase n=1 Tax=Luteimonas salinisoli TaxID=2752307 RepID=UPI00214D6A5B|nr:transposase [Luteimonas salinisoli]